MNTILLIEDNLEVRENTAEILELADYKVITAENGKEGVAKAKESLPNLIICDIMMPELDGYGVLRILSKNPKTAPIPFIFLTAKSEKSDFRKGMNLGADDYITKPFDETELLEVIETRLRKSEHIHTKFSGNLDDFNALIDKAKGIKKLRDLSNERKIKTFKNKEFIYQQGDYANFLYFIKVGQVKSFKMDEFGKKIVTNLNRVGDFIGYLQLFNGLEYNESSIATEYTEVAIIPKRDFLKLIYEDRDVAIQFIKMLSGNITEIEERLLQLAYASVRERVADCLIKLTEANTSSNNSLTVTREYLAEYVGTAKESLIRTLSDFKKEKLIETSGGTITLLDKAKLTAKK